MCAFQLKKNNAFTEIQTKALNMRDQLFTAAPRDLFEGGNTEHKVALRLLHSPSVSLW